MLNEKRRLWKLILFGMLTFGIYNIVFMWQMIDDINTSCGYVEKSDTNRSPNYLVVMLFSALTFGIYGFYWYYKQGNRLRNCGAEYGLRIDEKGGTYLLWMIFGSFLFLIGPLIAMYLFIGNVNKLCSVYNYKSRAQLPGVPSREPVTPQGQPPSQVTPQIPPVTQPGGTGARRTSGKLRCIRGAFAGGEIELQSGQEIVLGRSGKEAQLVLVESDISRKHCSVRFQADEQCYYVTDYSTYGVLINESQKLPKGVPSKVPMGSTLTLGTGSNMFMVQ